MLDLDIYLMLFIAALFLALLYLLDAILYKPLLQFMDDRESAIAKDLEAAKSMSDNTQALEEEAQAILSKAKNEASMIRQKAVEEEKLSAQSKLESKKAELEEEFKAFLQEVEEEKKTLKNTLLSQVPLFKESLKAKFNQI